MQVEFSRLELKEVLRNLGPDCEPEVREKLETALGQKVETVRTGDGGSIELKTKSTSLDDLRDVVRSAHNEAEGEIFRPLTRERDFPKGEISDEDLETINASRRVAYEAQQRMQRQRAGHQIIDMAERPVVPPIPDVAVGALNRYGDRCVQLDHENHSVFVCAQGHAYVATGLVTPGCPSCWGAGGGGSPGGAEAGRPVMDSEDPTVETF